MSETKKKMTFLQWLDNFWYYYKWWVIAAVFVIFGIWCLLQLLQTQEKDTSGDLTVLSVYAHPLTSEEYDVDKRICDVITDANGDVETKVVFNPYFITEEGTSQADMVTTSEFEMNLQDCYGDMILFDKPTIDNYIKKDIFEPIGNYIDLSKIPKEDIIYRGDVAVAVKLSESKILADMHFIIDEVYACVMFVPDDADETTYACRNNAKKAIEKLLEK